MTDEWIVHPNRSAIGPNKPGRNGHYRGVESQRLLLSQETCQAQVQLPPRWAHLGQDRGTVLFAGPTWTFVTGAARSFARRHFDDTTVGPFGFQRRGTWTYWDGTVSTESRLEGEDATMFVEQYLQALFVGAGIEVTERGPARGRGLP